jgi:hypothetical protein
VCQNGIKKKRCQNGKRINREQKEEERRQVERAKAERKSEGMKNAGEERSDEPAIFMPERNERKNEIPA